MMIASSLAQKREIASENGLIQGHSFEVLAIYNFEHEDKQVRLMKLRNPWGFNEWHGEWSDQSERWTPELRERFGYFSQKDQGIFFMAFEDYVEQYKRTSVVVEQVIAPQSHAKVQCTYVKERPIGSTKPAFFRFFLERDIDLSQETLTISVH